MVATAMAALLLSGCSAWGSATIGDPSSTMKISVVNDMGVSVDAVRVKAVGQKAFGEPLVQNGYLDDGAQAELCLDAQEGQLYDLALTCINGASYELHDLNLGDMFETELKVSPSTGLGYATYTSISLGDEINTLPDERAYSQKAAYEAYLVKVSLDLSHASVKVSGTTYKKDADIKVVGGKKLKLAIAAKDGYEVSKVTATCLGKKVKVTDKGDGVYVVKASCVADGLVIKVVAKEMQQVDTSWQSAGDSGYYYTPAPSQGSGGSDSGSSGGNSSGNSSSSGGSDSGSSSGSDAGSGGDDGGTGDGCFDI